MVETSKKWTQRRKWSENVKWNKILIINEFEETDLSGRPKSLLLKYSLFDFLQEDAIEKWDISMQSMLLIENLNFFFNLSRLKL